MLRTIYRRINRYIPSASIVIFALTLVCIAIHIIMYNSAGFADAFNRYISSAVRAALAFITNILPFSLAEAMVLFIPVVAVTIICLIWKRDINNNRIFVRCISGIFSAVCLIYSLFVVDMAGGYRGTGLDEKLSLDTADITAEELYDTTVNVIDGLCANVEYATFDSEGASVMMFDYNELSDMITESYDALSVEYDFVPKVNSRIKPLVVSNIMTYTYISGMYSFFTGEANVNVNYPDYVSVFSVAHEFAHQRGFAREDEANFMAYLACTTSENGYIRYCGYLNLYDYLAGALWDASPELYYKASAELPFRVKMERAAYSTFFSDYVNSGASKVSEAVNNTFLQVQGTAGVVSYDMVVTLAVGYHRAMN